jgi:hypothetical protein
VVGAVGRAGVVGVVRGARRGAGDPRDLGGGLADGLGVGGGGGYLRGGVREGLEGPGVCGGEDEGALVVGDGAEVVEDGLGGWASDPVDDVGDGDAREFGDIGGAEGGVEEVLEEQFVHGAHCAVRRGGGKGGCEDVRDTAHKRGHRGRDCAQGGM